MLGICGRTVKIGQRKKKEGNKYCYIFIKYL